MLAGSSLGLLPIVENKTLAVTYDLFVHDSLIGTYEYKENFTRAFNMYSKDKTQGLGEEGQAWALGTAKLFAADLAKNPKVEALITEYQLYFPDAKKEQKPAGQ